LNVDVVDEAEINDVDRHLGVVALAQNFKDFFFVVH
jgi:hypothetical protein